MISSLSFVSKSHRFLIATHNISKNEKIYIMFHQRFPHPVHDHIKTNYNHWCTMNVEKEKSTFFHQRSITWWWTYTETSATFTQFNNPPVGNFSGNIKKLFNTILQFHKSLKYVFTDVLHQLALVFSLWKYVWKACVVSVSVEAYWFIFIIMKWNNRIM